ncbi:hypothetical protein [Desulfocurvibacter africanus]|uniref:Uncharacterized protein n=1 Tax=Desulfocurvibacter africanus subsp. africanus str. Walvis Bay TaxID=690850 RepID=F3Z337_DESAF|nr:hypothetical protein [Desulfocurvibacter africanus]EGJ50281.1 hypothetical protein Desaf_1952 [Desulfocurvibacter africanus subsp. africanus str. Walvis Bay]
MSAAQLSIFSTDWQPGVVYVSGWRPIWVPRANLMIKSDDMPESACQGCPLAAYWHPMVPYAFMSNGRAYSFEKLCTIPLIKAGLILLREHMRSGGCGAKSDDYVQAVKLLGVRA